MQTQGVAATGQSYIHIVYNREIQSWLTGSFCDFHQVSRYVSYRDSSIAIRIVSWGYRIVTPLVQTERDNGDVMEILVVTINPWIDDMLNY